MTSKLDRSANHESRLIPQSSLRSLPRSATTLLLLYPLMGLWLLHISYFLSQANWSLELITGLALASTFYGLAVASLRGPTRLNFVVVYGMYLSVSHLGLVASDLLVPGSLQALERSSGLSPGFFQSWYFGSALKTAVALSGLGINSFFLGAGLFGWFGKRPSTATTSLSLDMKGNQSIFRISVVLLVVSTFYMLSMILLGILPLLGSYSDYIAGIAKAPYYHLFLIILALGLTFLLATGSRQQVRRHIIWFIFPAVCLLITGNRGEVFYAGAASVAILSIRGFRLRLKGLVFILFILFLLIPSVRQFRNTPFAERDLSVLSINFTDTFMELGIQIRPLIGTIQWIRNGEEYAYGGTYYLPVQRIVALLIPNMEREPIEGNRLDVQGRTPTQGYTVIAEAYFNFGEWGVAIVLGLIGAFLSFANRTLTSQATAFYGAVMAVLLNSQRNSFIFVPGHVIIIIAIFMVARILETMEARNPSEAHHRP